jgi:hypothetical protein
LSQQLSSALALAPFATLFQFRRFALFARIRVTGKNELLKLHATAAVHLAATLVVHLAVAVLRLQAAAVQLLQLAAVAV